MSVTKLLDRFFFSQEALFPLALFRAGFGLLLFVETLLWLPHAPELFSHEGLHVGLWSELAPTPLVAFSLVIALAMSSTLVTVGLWTRLGIVLTLVLRIYLYGIDLINEKAIYTVAMIVLVILFFSPCHRLFSLDVMRNKTIKLNYAPSLWRQLILLEVAQVYFFAGLVKLVSKDWWEGTTLFNVMQGRWATDSGLWLGSWLPFWCYGALSCATVLFELSACLLFIRRYRLRYALYAFIFHLGIQLTLYIEVLGYHFMWILFTLVIIPATEERWRKAKFYRALIGDDHVQA